MIHLHYVARGALKEVYMWLTEIVILVYPFPPLVIPKQINAINSRRIKEKKKLF